MCCLCRISGTGLNVGDMSVSRLSQGGKRDWPSHWALATFAVKDNKEVSGFNKKTKYLI